MGTDSAEKHSPKPKLKIDESSLQFMIAEFNRITDLDLYYRKNGDQRVAQLFGLSAAFIALVASVRKVFDLNSEAVFLYYLGSTIGALLIVFLGIFTLGFLIERSKLNVIFLRKQARIRNCFRSNDPGIASSLPYSCDDTLPPFTSLKFPASNLITFIATLNALWVGLIAFLIVLILKGNLCWKLSAVLIAFVTTFAAQWFFISKRLLKLQNSETGFPS
mgnify:CR=1 FL=1